MAAHYLVSFISFDMNPQGVEEVCVSSIEVSRDRPLAFGESVDLAEQVARGAAVHKAIVLGVIPLEPPR